MIPPVLIRNETKENLKGSVKSYNSRRNFIHSTFIFIFLSVAVIFIFKSVTVKDFGERKSNAITESLRQNNNKLQFSLNDEKHNKHIIDSVESNKMNIEIFGTISSNPIRNIDYGVQNTPIVMIKSELSKSLHERFLKEFLYSCTETELNLNTDLDNRVKVPYYIYEGYFHSLPTNNKIYSRNPNPLIGKDFMKPPADAFSRAFFDTFRYVNKDIFTKLKDNLLQASSHEAKDDDLSILASWIEKDYHFGDLSIQIHYGKGNIEKLNNCWHTDAENSLLHLAVTLRGDRILHSMRIQSNNTSATSKKENKIKEIFDSQKPGDLYLSSSTLKRYAPEFFDAHYSTRVIAMHTRILYASNVVNAFRRLRTNKSWKKLSTIIASLCSLIS